MLRRALGKSCLRQQVTQNSLDFWKNLKGPQKAQALLANWQEIPPQYLNGKEAARVKKLKVRSVEDLFKHKLASSIEKESSELTRQLEKMLDTLH